MLGLLNTGKTQMECCAKALPCFCSQISKEVCDGYKH